MSRMDLQESFVKQFGDSTVCLKYAEFNPAQKTIGIIDHNHNTRNLCNPGIF
jgi:hypothetical protein